ncbi:MAG TPA: hypothetical protein QF423_03710 [Candidatus Scalindua sp.]|nr:hypothetical protein [Candidatus Scalindua sp.]
MGKREHYKLIFNNEKEINAQIIAMSPEEIEIVPEDSTQSVTVNFRELDKILEAKNYISSGKIAGRTITGAGVGAGIGALFFGIGAIPGVIIGSISGRTTSSTSIEYENDVLPRYCTSEASLRQNLNN